ncbi:MAG: phenylacetic acid degradation b [Flammeovirgaceae bacterium]|nr:phenylacetic acid degradation b [Flammeovirgaceae bacterium]
MSVKSLDPRVNRLPGYGASAEIKPKAALDQLGTFEVFVQAKEGKPFQHEGIVHASDIELAFVMAKEAFTRRFQCVSLYTVDTRDVYVSPLTDGNQSAYTLVQQPAPQTTEKEKFEIYHLLKRGKQHVHVGSVEASSPQEAMYLSKEKFSAGKVVFNIWAIRTKAIRFTRDEDKDLWLTLPEKKYRDAADYKAGNKLSEFLAKTKSNS